MKLSILNNSSDDNQYLNTGGYVYPEQIVEFTFSNVMLPEDLPQVLTGILEYEYNYYNSSKKMYQSKRKFSIFIERSISRIEWKSIEEVEEEI